MIGKLADLYVRIVRRLARDLEPRRLQPLFVLAIEFIPMPVPLVDFARAVRPMREAPFGQLAGPVAQPHGAAQVLDALQFAQLENDAMWRAGIEFRGIGRLQSADVA